MNRTRSALLSLALIVCSALVSFSQQPSSSEVLARATGQAAATLDLQPGFRAPGVIPAAIPVAGRIGSPGAEKTMAPKPGKDLSPVVQDQARVKAILKLVTDIYLGNQLPYSQDGVVFKNKEGRLPARPAGYYHEYTLLTGSAPHTVVIGGIAYQVAPDLSARGSERLIIGGGENIYYTPDHYAKFIQLTMVY